MSSTADGSAPTPSARSRPGSRLVEVAVALPVRGTFTYDVPAQWTSQLRVGARVRVPFGAREVAGYVVGLDAEAPEGTLPKPIGELEQGEPSLDPALIRLLMWAAEYYLAPPGELVRAALPPGAHSTSTRRVELVDGDAQPKNEPEARVLEALKAAPDHSLDQRSIVRLGEVANAVAALVRRGVARRAVAERAARVRARRERTLRLVRTPTDEERAALARAPRRAELLALVERAGGAPVALGALGAIARARTHAEALVSGGLLSWGERELVRDPFRDEPIAAHPPPRLTAHQEIAVGAIETALAAREFHTFLLHGVTGSGKTEVYLRAIAAARQAGRGAVVLVPEISLTPQLAARFRSRFGDDAAVLHSGLSEGERFDAWRRLRDGRVGIALGARSAVFAPVRDLAVIVVDEEHDGSFKQEEGVRYHARDLALVRAQQAGATCVLGSATPSLESLRQVELGRAVRLELPERATARPLPEVELIDLRKYRPDRDGLLSGPLALAIEETLRAGEQAILFLNRRGFATFLLCKACGHALRCRFCSVALTLHRDRGAAICHYCGAAARPPTKCPQCEGPPVAELGVGTERLEAALRARFPEARIGRLDRDTGAAGGLRKILGAMARGELDVLVGTQMVTKGHDFPGVTLVGVVMADTGLHRPDFRAAERTFQLLLQVAGRAGRGERPGRVLIQTYLPEHPAIASAAEHDYEGFARAELAARRELGYPPFGRLVALRVDGRDPEHVRAVAEELARVARGVAAAGPVEAPPFSVLGPAEAPIARIRGRARWQLMLRGPDRRLLRAAASRAIDAVGACGQVRVTIDVDPVNSV